MNATRAAWGTLVAVVLAGTACGNNVTVDPTGSGGSTTSAGGQTASVTGTGGETSVGSPGAGGEGATGQGGSTGGQGGNAGAGGQGGAEPTCPSAGDVCTQCLSEQCGAVYCACYEEIHCGGYLQCLGTCMMGDTACYQNCAAVHAPGISAAVLTADCAATTCDASCDFGQALNDCQKCLYTQCDQEMNACIADAECIALIQCIQMCAPGDMACGQACVGQHPDGLPEAQAVRDCRIQNCTDVCN